MRDALLSGINVIVLHVDEQHKQRLGALKQILLDLNQTGRIRRTQLIFVLSLGFHRPANAWPAVATDPGLHWSLHPRFLQARIDEVMEWLSLDCIDVLQIQYPEIGLEFMQPYGLFLRQNLAQWQAAGRIRFFGICTAQLTTHQTRWQATDFDHLYGPRQVLQFPANLLESDFRFQRDQSGATFVASIRAAQVWTISFRPFKNLYNKQLLLLAGNIEPSLDQGASVKAELNHYYNLLKQQEKIILDLFAGQHFRFSASYPAPSAYLRQYQNHFYDVLVFDQYAPAIHHHLQKTSNQLALLMNESAQRFAVERFCRLLNKLLATWRRLIAELWQKRIDFTKERIYQTDPAYAGHPMTLCSLLYLLSTDIPHTVIIAVHDTRQLSQLLQAFSLDLPATSSHWQTVRATEEAVSQLGQIQDDDIIPGETA
ncbi:MAG: hypothetical protein KDK39_00515 [Leptospiraceae bacterium]|nr:hypothetical protein [Leptospiraceae bacterium]